MSGVTDRIFRAFLSTLSLRRATCQYHAQVCAACISIHALLAESDAEYLGVSRATYISIHALLAESDVAQTDAKSVILKFLSTLSLRRATFVADRVCTNHGIFLSTLSLRRATTPVLRQVRRKAHFYPRSPCGERRRGPRR